MVALKVMSKGGKNLTEYGGIAKFKHAFLFMFIGDNGTQPLQSIINSLKFVRIRSE